MAHVKLLQAVPPPGPWRLESRTLGALPVVNHFLDRLQLEALLGRYVSHRNRRLRLPPATVLALLLRNVLLGRAPVYALEEWATPFDPAQLRLTAAQVSLLNDDRVGRALDELFDARIAPRSSPRSWCAQCRSLGLTFSSFTTTLPPSPSAANTAAPRPKPYGAASELWRSLTDITKTIGPI